MVAKDEAGVRRGRRDYAEDQTGGRGGGEKILNSR